MRRDVDVLVEDGVITAVGRGLPDDDDATARVARPVARASSTCTCTPSTAGAWSAPALLTSAGLSAALASRGVTGFLATTVTAPLDALRMRCCPAT